MCVCVKHWEVVVCLRGIQVVLQQVFVRFCMSPLFCLICLGFFHENSPFHSHYKDALGGEVLIV